MRIFAAITVFLLLFRPAFAIMEYVVNYDYISKVLCINKEKPKLKCHGKCYLMKELAKAADAEKQNSSSDKKTNLSVELFCNTAQDINLPEYRSQLLHTLVSDYQNMYAMLRTYAIFHPPSQI